MLRDSSDYVSRRRTDRLVISSSRHGGIRRLHSVGVPAIIIEPLIAHSAGNVHEGYIHKDLLSMKTLKEGLEYPSVFEALSKSQELPTSDQRGKAA